jgi:23S rRNA pseudouridine1911/1915/1917 synthase
MASIHYPIVGDKTYGGRPHIPRGASPELLKALAAYNHQALHATRLQLTHPKTHELVEWSIPLPDQMQALIDLLRTK